MEKIEVLGKKFGKLTAIKDDTESPAGHRYIICKCDCGNYKSIRKYNLMNDLVLNCGCEKKKIKKTSKIDLTNKRFGRLLVLNSVPNRKGRTRWLCQCDCGNKKEIDTRHIVNKYSTNSCGCLLIEHNDRYKLEKGESSFNSLLRVYKRGATKRGLDFTISSDEFRKITKQDCYYCGENPSNIKTGKTHYGEYIYNGVDRVDNAVGYVDGNCVSCCEFCNRMKMNHSVADFFKKIKKIYHLHLSKNLPTVTK